VRHDVVQALLQGVDGAGDVWEIPGPATGGGVCGGDRFPDCSNAFGERRGGLIGEAVVVLDDVYAGARESGRGLGELGGRQPQRLDCGAEEGTLRGARQRPDARDPEARSGKRVENVRREREVYDSHTVHEGDVAVDDVEHLSEFGAGCGEGVRDADGEAPCGSAGRRGFRSRGIPFSFRRGLYLLDASQHP